MTPRHDPLGLALSALITALLYGGPGLAFLASEVLPSGVTALEPVRDVVYVDAAVDDGGLDWETTPPSNEAAAPPPAQDVEVIAEPSDDGAPVAPPEEADDAETEAPAAPEAGTTKPPAKGGKTVKGRCNRVSKDIQKVGERHFKVARHLVEYHTASIERINALGWSKSYDEGGQKGTFVSGFGCTSDPYLAGLRRGDVIQEVNGKKTNNLLQVFFAWQKLKNDDHFIVRILRDNRPLTLTYDVI